MKFTATEIQDIKFALEHVWQAIGSDIMEVVEGNAIARAELIEMVLDADRVDMYGDLNPDLLGRFKALSYEDKINIAEQQFTYLSYS